MTQDELRLLTDLANKIAQTPSPQRDPEAEAFIRARIGNRPDALYLMTQTVLIQNMALEQAQAQIRDLQQRAGSAVPGRMGPSGSFLGQQPAVPPQAQPQYQQPPYAPQQSQYAPAAAMPSPSVGGFGSGGGFLKGAAQTAAGVAAGALAFEGIRSLFSHPFGGSGIGGFGGAGFMGGGMPIEETVINNYYDSPGGEARGSHQLADTSDVQDYTDQGADQQDDGAQLQDADYDDSNGSDDGSSGFDDSSGDLT